MSETEIPQWKKDLIARLRSQNKRTATAQQQLFGDSQASSLVQQPAAIGRERCECAMVQKCDEKSDSDEDLHYGPGIVNKLKERYLSLAQREKTTRPTILRKATSLENILDDAPAEPNRLFQPSQNKNLPNRYTKRGAELKRARSVETISSSEEREGKELKRESLHEDMLISNRGSLIIAEKPTENVEKYAKINRPKRIAPVMNEKEKPPADVVKQAKMIFERRPEQRTKPPQQTGEVAAKVASFKSIIVQNKPLKKPAIKVKPVLDRPKTNGVRNKTREVRPTSPEKKLPPLPSPDISRVETEENGTSLTETPDLIITSSPIPNVQSPAFRKTATENFIKEEIRSSQIEPKQTSPLSSQTFNFNQSTPITKSHLTTNENILDEQTPPSEPLNLIINGTNDTTKQHEIPKPILSTLEIEKNLKNTAKTLDQTKNRNVNVKSEVTTNNKVPKVKKPPPISDGNSVVFKFVDRKDVPDHVPNDGLKRVAIPEKPKVGEGGIIWISGASLESSTDEDQEIMRSLECPPSPCDVVFINDNILIDGKSSIRQKTKKAKLKISFLDEGPEVYEYPSETSLLVEESPTSPIRNSVPSLSGTSSLANYTPKSTEDFQPGVTRSVQNAPIPKQEIQDFNELILQEVEKPIMFSSGANSDILF